MNDSEIIKTLEYCITNGGCYNCPHPCNACNDKEITECAYDLINRQQAEIARLREENKVYKTANINISRQRDIKEEEIECLESQLQTSKSKAVREFAENLKRKSELVAPSVWAIPYRAVAVADIDKLLEGMGCNDG